MPELTLDLARYTDPGFTPGRQEIPEVLQALIDCDEEQAPSIERALARAGLPAAQQANQQIENASPPTRVRLVRLVGRVARETSDADLCASLCDRLGDSEAIVQRAAVIGLGKLKDPGVENTLLVYAAREHDLPELRVLAEALGKVGGPRAAEWLSNQSSADSLTQRLIERAQLMLSRSVSRPEQVAALDLTVPLGKANTLLFTCRVGLETILREEAQVFGDAQMSAGRVTIAQYAGSLADALVPRTALTLGLQLALDRQLSLHQAVVEALKASNLFDWMTQTSGGTPRVRLNFLDQGHQRAAVWDLQTLMVREGLPITTDPTSAAWEIAIDSGNARLELLPKRFDDPRFAWRTKDIPAASHPTIAAALARVAGVRPDDVVWDPFVGSGLELVERGLLGAYRVMYGTDIDETALAAAKANLMAAQIKHVTLLNRDATVAPVRDITLVITNPPMGARLVRDGTLGELLEAALSQGWRVMQPQARWVWLSPMPARTAAVAHHLGFDVERLGLVDVGGLSPELQILRVPGRQAQARSSARARAAAGPAPSPNAHKRRRIVR
jgi:23S rRNA G2445 N2-methylase RlmL